MSGQNSDQDNEYLFSVQRSAKAGRADLSHLAASKRTAQLEAVGEVGDDVEKGVAELFRFCSSGALSCVYCPVGPGTSPCKDGSVAKSLVVRGEENARKLSSYVSFLHSLSRPFLSHTINILFIIFILIFSFSQFL